MLGIGISGTGQESPRRTPGAVGWLLIAPMVVWLAVFVVIPTLILLVYAYLPFMILPIFSSAEKVDESVIEASQDLGAGALQTFWRVILPLTRPGVSAGVMLVFVPAIGMFAITDLMGGARVPMVGNVIQSQFGAARNWPFGAALGILFMALFVTMFWLLRQREAKA